MAVLLQVAFSLTLSSVNAHCDAYLASLLFVFTFLSSAQFLVLYIEKRITKKQKLNPSANHKLLTYRTNLKASVTITSNHDLGSSSNILRRLVRRLRTFRLFCVSTPINGSSCFSDQRYKCSQIQHTALTWRISVLLSCMSSPIFYSFIQLYSNLFPLPSNSGPFSFSLCEVGPKLNPAH